MDDRDMADRFFPMRDGSYTLSSGFGARWGTQHRGLDFAAKDGTPIYAAQAGTVAYIGPADGFGQWIVIDHPAAAGAGTTVYGHMWNAFATGLRAGDRVAAGQLIAYVGANGQSTGPHLHFEVHPTVWRQGSQIDPLPWLRGARNPGDAPAPATPAPGGNTVGDPVWLLDALRPAVDKLVEYPGWRQRGHGDFKDIRGVMVHHTGGPATAASIANGRPDLTGPLANLHIARDGTVTIVAVGVCWHAGAGSWSWLPANMGNWHLIGIECEWPYGEQGITERNASSVEWKRPQIIAIRNVCAALLSWMRFGTDRLLGHKDYAGPAQGKWDPGNMDMTWLRGEVRKDMDGFVFPGEDGPRPIPFPTTPAPTDPLPPKPAPSYAGVLLHRGMSGPAVSRLQTLLRKWYSKLAVDGDFGPHTEACVRDFQRLRPPLAVDGIVGPATAARLGLVL
ncbi:lysin A [Mycobacterium phage Terror]|uniref:Lysin A n=1 Tax=Mycobacterium phage Taheera TaxID=1897549 RepID=A0A1D8EVR5_9CAUD|nr:endolysin [Mycobacterium phage Taheera]AOT25138.1 lysin A [Mycobacterium phage Taheera]AOT25198.1 lysin A [Mycobacterium phage Terror]